MFKFASSKLIIIRDALKFNMVNIGGVDIHNGEKKLILATMWLIIRKHTLNVIYLNKRWLEIKLKINYWFGQMEEYQKK